MKHGGTSAFSKKLSGKSFILSNIIILFVGLIFLGILYYILNIQYQPSRNLLSLGPVTTEPKSLRFDIEQPGNDIISYSDSMAVSGQTGPAKDVLIYTDSDNVVVRSKQDGSFSATLDLEDGENNITVAVFDSNGQSRSAERTVYYSKEKI